MALPDEAQRRPVFTGASCNVRSGVPGSGTTRPAYRSNNSRPFGFSSHKYAVFVGYRTYVRVMTSDLAAAVAAYTKSVDAAAGCRCRRVLAPGSARRVR